MTSDKLVTYVFHYPDGFAEQWTPQPGATYLSMAQAALQMLEGAGIPYGLVVGGVRKIVENLENLAVKEFSESLSEEAQNEESGERSALPDDGNPTDEEIDLDLQGESSLTQEIEAIQHEADKEDYDITVGDVVSIAPDP